MTRWHNDTQRKLQSIAIGVSIAASYAILCWAARKLSMDQFYLPAGIRVASLIVIPTRLWPYLILGEYVYFAEMRVPLIDKYGLAWVVLASATLMPSVAMIVHSSLRSIGTGSEVRILIACGLSSIVVTALNVGLSHTLWEVAPPNPARTETLRYAIGDYVGMLTIVPLAMLWHRRERITEEDDGFFRCAPAAIAMMTALGVAAVVLPSGDQPANQLLQLTMAVPAIAMTCYHGWKGAAITVPVLNMLVGIAPSPWNQPYWSFDGNLFVTQQILALAGTALLCMGATISRHYKRHTEGSRREILTVAHAKTAHLSAEMELRRRAINMREATDRTDHTLSEIGTLLSKKGDPALAESLMKVAVATSRTLREQTSMVYPTALEHVGLYLTLQVSGISREWEETHRMLPLRLKGDPCRLTVGLQLAAYRSLAEATSLLLSEERGSVHLTARCGRLRNRQGIVMVISLADRSRTLKEGTKLRVLARITGRTLAYLGSVSCRRSSVRILLTEQATARTAVEHELNLNPAMSTSNADVYRSQWGQWKN